MKSKILIIGGGGFVGMNIAKFLIRNRDCKLVLADHEFVRNADEYFSNSETANICFVMFWGFVRYSLLGLRLYIFVLLFNLEIGFWPSLR